MDSANPRIDGFKFSAVAAGVKHANTERLDLTLIVSDVPCAVAGTFTRNIVAAAPVHICRDRIRGGLARAIIANSGNANACTGPVGTADAITLTGLVAKELGAAPEMVFPMSTGVIGAPLPMDRMVPCVPTLVKELDEGKFSQAAQAILTTDTAAKTVEIQAELSNGPFRVVGMSKGSGMIAPSMATMLAVILADVKVDRDFLQQCLGRAVEATFNRVTVDGDTSTNDTVLAMAGGSATARELPDAADDREVFYSVMEEACGALAKQIALDGEGATKLVEVLVVGAPDTAAAAKVARTIAESPLVKTAFHGGDPNWGRIICAAGRTGVTFDPDKVDLFIGDAQILKNGVLATPDWEPPAAEVMKAKEFSVRLDLKSGNGSYSMLTTDLSEEYVGINADYRS